MTTSDKSPVISFFNCSGFDGILLMGPTGVGKTYNSVHLAEKLGGEIISVDSVHVYKGLDIGSAKVTEEEMKGIPHHLIDIVNISDMYNVVRFLSDVRKCIHSVISRGKLPILVGGSTFYARILVSGLHDLSPAPNTSVREKYNKIASRDGVGYLYGMLRELDVEYSQSITSGDVHKIIRALEIIELSGKKVSDLKCIRSDCGTNKLVSVLPVWLSMCREKLYENIEERCELMFSLGFLEEVYQLLELGLSCNVIASNAIGYREVSDFIGGIVSMEDCKKKIKKRSRNLAKKQISWLNSMKIFNKVDAGKDAYNHVLKLCS